MDAEVAHAADVGLFLLEEPCVGAFVLRPCFGAAVAERRAEGHDFADDAFLEELLGLQVGGHEALVVADHELAAELLSREDHLGGVFEIGGHRLLAEDVLAGLQAGDRQAGMLAVGRADADGVDVLVVDDSLFAIDNWNMVQAGEVFGA